MLSILILSQNGEGYELSQKLLNEGHIVKYWNGRETINSWPKHERFQAINRYEEVISTSDLCVVLGGGNLADRISQARKLVVGGTLQDLLLAGKPLEQVGMNLLGLNKSNKEGLFDLTLCGWFNGIEFINSFIVQHYTRLLDGNYGPVVKDMGCLVWREESCLTNLIPLLQETKYKGFIGIDVKMTEDELYFEQFTFNLNASMLMAIIECSQVSLANILYAAASQRVLNKSKGNIGIAVNLLDFGGPNPKLNKPQEADKHFLPAIETGHLGCVAARGESIHEVRKRVYRSISNIVSLDVIYRKDIGCSSLLEAIQKGE